MTITIRVEQKHIAAGSRTDEARNPIILAAAEQHPTLAWEVSNGIITCRTRSDCPTERRHTLHWRARMWLDWWYRTGQCAPIIITLD